jgi:hypothetical protein
MLCSKNGTTGEWPQIWRGLSPQWTKLTPASRRGGHRARTCTASRSLVGPVHDRLEAQSCSGGDGDSLSGWPHLPVEENGPCDTGSGRAGREKNRDESGRGPGRRYARSGPSGRRRGHEERNPTCAVSDGQWKTVQMFSCIVADYLICVQLMQL